MNEICAALCFIGLILLLILLCKDMSGDDSLKEIKIELIEIRIQLKKIADAMERR